MTTNSAGGSDGNNADLTIDFRLLNTHIEVRYSNDDEESEMSNNDDECSDESNAND